ncbi:MAG: amidohydrolase family protein [Patescibacteria group bacterium]
MRDLPLGEYRPRSELVVAETPLERSRLPVTDAHNHAALWWETGRPVEDLLRLMDELGIERMVNISGFCGDDWLSSYRGFEERYPRRFATIGLLDLAGLGGPGFEERLRREMRRMKEAGLHGFKAWKDLGLRLRDTAGRLVMPDDERLAPVWNCAAELGLPVFLHLADPVAFFKPLDATNERYEELRAHPDWHFFGPEFPGFDELLAAQERLLAREKGTSFILAHVAGYAENLAYVSGLLDRLPHVHIDLSARFGELGRQPRAAREFILRHADRILYGLDGMADPIHYRLTFRLLETLDEYFPYAPGDPPPQGRWRVYGLGLPDDVLAKIYRENARRLIPGLCNE